MHEYFSRNIVITVTFMDCVTSANECYIGVKGFLYFMFSQFFSYFYCVFNRNIEIRLLWFIAFSVSLWLSGSMIKIAWIQWLNEPMTYSGSESLAGIDTIPFPTVTSCPEIRAIKTKLDVSSLYNLSDIQ